MTRKIRSYEADDIVVDYDVKRCIHAEACVRRLPRVFDATRRPWIDPTQGSPEDIAQAIQQCPSGALHYRVPGEDQAEQPPRTNSARVSQDGPLYIKGRLRLNLPGGETLEETRAALCRCGMSKDKPFCDNSHVESGFTHDGTIAEIRLKPAEDDDGGLEISLANNGPILVSGRLEVVNDRGDVMEMGGCAFCRCGQSSTKPFCDGTHKKVGFQAE